MRPTSPAVIKEMGYKAGTKADPNAITPQQARTAFARYCKKIDVTKRVIH